MCNQWIQCKSVVRTGVFLLAFFLACGFLGVEKASAQWESTAEQYINPGQNQGNQNARPTGNVRFHPSDVDIPQLVRNSTPPPVAKNVCGVGDWILHPFNCPLLAILGLVGNLLAMANTLFGWMIDPKDMLAVMSNPAIYTAWSMVRDLLNIGFILVLLFSAFATVFQVDKYNYKKILFNLVLMALLVNFSYPISRVIIDFSNVMMYSTVNNLDIKNKSFAVLSDKSKLGDIISPKGDVGKMDSTFLVAAVVFSFILAVTLLMIAVLFLIRTVTLAILIIFSPIAFTGSIIPGLSSHSGKWWTQLFSNAFFGPIMVFMLYIATEMMENISATSWGSMKNVAANQSSDPGFIAAMSFFTIPIVILWLGIGMAKTMGAVGADMVVGKGTKFMNWAANYGTGYKLAKWYGKDLRKDHIDPWIEGWKSRRNEMKKDKRDFRAARARDVYGNILSPGEREEDYYRNVKKAELLARLKKEQESVSTTDSWNFEQIKKLEGKKDLKSQLRLQAHLMTMAEQKDMNEYMKLQGKDTDPFKLKKNMYDRLIAQGMSEEDAAKAALNVGNSCFAQGMYANGGMATYDDFAVNPETWERLKDENGNYIKTGKFRHRMMSDTDQLAWFEAKMKAVDLQKLLINIHPDAMIIENKDGKGIGVHKMGKAFATFLEDRADDKGIPHMNRPRGDFYSKVEEGIEADKEDKNIADKDKFAKNHSIFSKAVSGQNAKKEKGSGEEKENSSQEKTSKKLVDAIDKLTEATQKGTQQKAKKEPKIEIVGGGSYSSRGKTTFDEKGNPRT